MLTAAVVGAPARRSPASRYDAARCRPRPAHRGLVGLSPWVKPLPRPCDAPYAGVMAYATTNPATGETVKTFETATDQQIRDAVARSAKE